MAAVIPNFAKGKWAYWGTLPEAADSFYWVLFSGTETDDNIRNADTLADLIATTLNEATFTGYTAVSGAGAGKAATGVVVTVDDTNDWITLDVDDPSWSPTSAEALTRIALVYDSATGSGTNTTVYPVFVDDFALTTPTSGTITYQVATGGPLKAS